MNQRVDRRVVRFCSAFASISSVFAVGTGLTVLVAWNLHILPLLTWGAVTPMAANLAAGRLRNLPIIEMTAHAMRGDYKQSLDAGMNDHLTKPINPETLKKALLKWMPARTVRSAKPNVPIGGTVQDDSYMPEKLAPFDIQAALRRTNGKPKLLRKLMFSFCNQFAHTGTDLRQLLDEGKRDEAGRLAHTLKGVALTLEAAELGESAFAVENAIRFGDAPDLEPLIKSMENMLASAITAAASLQGSAAKPEGTGSSLVTTVVTNGRNLA